MDPREAERRVAARLEEAGLPRFASAVHDAKLDLLEITWGHGVTLFMDLTRKDIDGPIGGEERAVILGLAPCCEDCAPIDVYVPGSADDPRTDTSIPGAGRRLQQLRRGRRRARLSPSPATLTNRMRPQNAAHERSSTATSCALRASQSGPPVSTWMCALRPIALARTGKA